MLDYLNQTLGLEATMTPWAEADRFPLYLRSGKKYFLLHIGGVECVLIEADEKNFSLPQADGKAARPTRASCFVLQAFGVQTEESVDRSTHTIYCSGEPGLPAVSGGGSARAYEIGKGCS